MWLERHFCLIPIQTIKQLEQIQEYPPIKLIELCKAINTNYRNGHHDVVAVLIRTICNYIPTIYGFESCELLRSQIKCKRTFKEALGQLHDGKVVADDFLHATAHTTEHLKADKVSSELKRDSLSLVLNDIVSTLGNDDKRTAPPFRGRRRQLPQSQLQQMEKMINQPTNWYEEIIDDEKMWIHKRDNLYQIIERTAQDDFTEPWTQVFPDKKGSGSFDVDLLYNGQILKRLQFIYCDGGRIRVPMPEMGSDPSKNIWEGKDLYGGSYKGTFYYWNTQSIEYKVGQLIKHFHLYRSMEGVAEVAKIEIQ